MMVSQAAKSNLRQAPSRGCASSEPPHWRWKNAAVRLQRCCVRLELSEPYLVKPSLLNQFVLGNFTWALLPVAGGLQLEHFRVATAEVRQHSVVSFFRNASVLQHHDSIRHPHRRESV